MKCISSGSLHEPLLMTATIAVLSHWNVTLAADQIEPQVTAVNYIRMNSLVAILEDAHSGH